MFRGVSLWTGILSGGVNQIQDTKSYNNGQMNRNDYAVHTAKNVTEAIGVMAGIEYGAILGTTMLPGIGTIAGSILGFFVGDRLGSYVGLQAGNIIFNKKLFPNIKETIQNNNPFQKMKMEEEGQATFQ